MFSEKLTGELLFLDDLAALRDMAAVSQYSLRKPFRSKNPEEVRGVFRGTRVGVSGRPKRIQMDGGGGVGK